MIKTPNNWVIVGQFEGVDPATEINPSIWYQHLNGVQLQLWSVIVQMPNGIPNSVYKQVTDAWSTLYDACHALHK